jgi:hypothetical protein
MRRKVRRMNMRLKELFLLRRELHKTGVFGAERELDFLCFELNIKIFNFNFNRV